MIVRTKDVVKIIVAIAPYRELVNGFDVFEWVEDDDNIALTNEHGDLMLFTALSHWEVEAHYFFKSRGREAVKQAKAMAQHVFSEYGIKTITGYTPITNLGARWVNRQLKLKSHGIVNTDNGLCEHVSINDTDWSN